MNCMAAINAVISEIASNEEDDFNKTQQQPKNKTPAPGFDELSHPSIIHPPIQSINQSSNKGESVNALAVKIFM